MGLRARLDHLNAPLVRAAAAFTAGRVWTDFGYARLDDHARERFHLTGRWIRDLAAVGRALEALPALEDAMTGADGRPPVSLVAARIIAANATPETISDWLHLARTRSVRRLREEAATPPAPAAADTTMAAGLAAITAGNSATTAGNSAAADDTTMAAAISEEGEPRAFVYLRAPGPVRESFDEGLELFRAVEGHDASVSSYVEALVAEALATWPELATATAADPGLAGNLNKKNKLCAPRERLLELATQNWSRLRTDDARGTAGDRGTGDAPSTVGDPSSESARSTEGDRSSESAHGTKGDPSSPDSRTDSKADPEQRLRELLATRRVLERQLDHLLALMAQLRAWSALRFASLEHYAEERLGMSRSSARERARLCRSLEDLPELRAACESGKIGVMAALELVRLLEARPGLSPETRRAWVERARRATVKRLRDEVRALRRTPDGAAGEAAALAGEPPALSGEAAALTRDPAALIGEPTPLTDDAWHRSLARRTGDARARIARLAGIARRFALTQQADFACSADVTLSIGDSGFEGAGTAACRPLPQMSRMGWWLPADLAAAFRAAMAHAARTTSAAAVGSAALEGHPPLWMGLLALIENFVDTWDVDQDYQRPSRVAIYVRDGWRCMAPGCTSRRNLEDHHVIYRSHGGDDEPDNRVCLCRFHHQRGEHGELARVRGRAPLGLRWSLGRHGCGGAFRNEIRLADRA